MARQDGYESEELFGSGDESDGAESNVSLEIPIQAPRARGIVQKTIIRPRPILSDSDGEEIPSVRARTSKHGRRGLSTVYTSMSSSNLKVPSCQNRGTLPTKSSATSRAKSQKQSKENLPPLPPSSRDDVSDDTIPLQLAETNSLLHELIAHVKKTDRVQLLEEKLESASSSSSASATPKRRKKSVPLAVRVRLALCNCPPHSYMYTLFAIFTL